MAKLKLKLLTSPYEIVRALREGSVTAEGIDIEFVPNPGIRQLHEMIYESEGFDVGEYNAGAYMAARMRGIPFTALPVFLHRRFRHGFVFINSSKGIEKPTDLIGKRVGGTSFAPAGNLWARGILENDYGVPHRSITWVTKYDEQAVFDFHPDLVVERIPEHEDLEDMLLDGELDAMVTPNVVRGIEEGDRRVARLFPDYKDIEIAYFKKTGLFPIMHVTIIRERIVDEHPWVVESLVNAFEASKQAAYRRLANPRIVPIAWYQTAREEELALLGSDPWEYGLSAANRRNLETLIGYVHQQGLTDRRVRMDELFPKQAFEMPRPIGFSSANEKAPR